MKMKAFIVSIIICAVIVLGSIGVYCSWNAIVGTINGNKYYTSQDLQSVYDKGYDDGIKNETELTAQVEYYKGLVDSQYTSIAGFQKDIADYKKLNENLSNGIEEKQQQVTILENQVKTLQSLNDGQQETNEQNLKTIETLNNQIKTLNLQISDMSSQIQNNSSNVSALNSKIAELEKSVAYYEQYIANLENGEQIVVTFEFNGSVYNIQIVNKGSNVNVVTPTSTEKVIFNYWEINGEQIDLSTYNFNTNVKVVANITLKNSVQFNADDRVIDTQYVVTNSIATLPTPPTKNSYVFDGWTLNGIDIIDISNCEITKDTIFYAKFTKLHNVTFMYESKEIEIMQVKNGECATAPLVENTIYKVFNGWLLNDIRVNLEEYKIFADMILTADITYYYQVNFKLDSESDDIYNSQIIESGNYVMTLTNPSKVSYQFDGWSIDGENLIELSNYKIDNHVTFIAIFSECKFGYFSEDGKMLYSWDDLLNGGYFSLVTSMGGNSLYANDSFKALDKGILKISSDFTGISGMKYCTNLLGLELPNNITSLSSNVFYGCTNLKYVKLPDTFKKISSYAFAGCSLSYIYIPSSCTSIGEWAFSENRNIIVYCEITEKQLGWNSLCFWREYEIEVEVKYGYTYEQYLTEVGLR